MSDKTVAQKLLIKDNYKVLLVSGPEGYGSRLGALPPNTTLLTEPPGQSTWCSSLSPREKSLKRSLGHSSLFCNQKAYCG
jgi:hypothetical protein